MAATYELEHLRKLFIGGLPQSTEENLRKYFEEFGSVENVNIMRDLNTNRPRGFGFVTFKSSASVDRTQASRPHCIEGKSVQTKRVLPKTERDNNVTVEKIFVGGLKDVHNEDDIREHFSKFGNIISINILTDKNTGKRRGFAYVEYDDYDAVDKAVLQESHILKNIAIDVKKSIYKDQTRHHNNQSNNIVYDPNVITNKLFVGGLKNNHDEHSLNSYFSQFGQVVSINILTDKTTGKRRGFGYVEFCDSNAVENAMAQPVHRIKNMLVDVKKSVYVQDQTKSHMNKVERPPIDPNIMVKKVFVGGVRNVHDELSLRTHFSQFGTVTSVKIVVDKNTGKRRGFAYVEFSDFDGVERAVAYNGHKIRDFIVDVKKSVYNQDSENSSTQQSNGTEYQQGIGVQIKQYVNLNRPNPYIQMANNNFGINIQAKAGMMY